MPISVRLDPKTERVVRSLARRRLEPPDEPQVLDHRVGPEPARRPAVTNGR